MVSLQQLIRYKDIVLYRTQAGIKSEGRQNYLGYIWFLLEPLMSTAVLYFAWTTLSGGAKGPKYILMILIGMITWQWFEGSVMLGSTSIKAKFHVLNQFALPKYIFPVVAILVNSWKFLCVFLLILVFSTFVSHLPSGPAFAWHPPGSAFVWLPVVLATQLVLIVAVTMTLSIVVTLVNDMLTVVSSAFRLLFFVSGLFFTVDSITFSDPVKQEQIRNLFHWNPMAVLIESYRKIIIDNTAPDWVLFSRVVGIAAVFLVVGFALNAYYDKKILKLTNV